MNHRVMPSTLQVGPARRHGVGDLVDEDANQEGDGRQRAGQPVGPVA